MNKSPFVLLALILLLGCGPKSQPQTANSSPEHLSEATTNKSQASAVLPEGQDPCDWLAAELRDKGPFAQSVQVDVLDASLEVDQPWPLPPLADVRVAGRDVTENAAACAFRFDVGEEPMQEALTDWETRAYWANFDLSLTDGVVELVHASLLATTRDTFAVTQRDDEGQAVTTSYALFRREACDQYAGPFLAADDDSTVLVCSTELQVLQQELIDGAWEATADTLRVRDEAIVLDAQSHPRLLTELHSESMDQMYGDDHQLTTVAAQSLDLHLDGVRLLAVETTTQDFFPEYPCDGGGERTDLQVLSFLSGKVTLVFQGEVAVFRTQQCDRDEEAERFSSEVGLEEQEDIELSELWEVSTEDSTGLVLTLIESTETPEAVGTQVIYRPKDGRFVEIERLPPPAP